MEKSTQTSLYTFQWWPRQGRKRHKRSRQAKAGNERKIKTKIAKFVSINIVFKLNVFLFLLLFLSVYDIIILICFN